VAQLDITKLHCVKTNDGYLQMDEIDVYLAIDGIAEDHYSGPHSMDKTNKHVDVTLHIHQPFNDKVVVRLRERDGGLGGTNDVDLGTHSFEATQQDAKVWVFDGNSGRVKYEATIGVSIPD
jgi:hypothetical protein